MLAYQPPGTISICLFYAEDDERWCLEQGKINGNQSIQNTLKASPPDAPVPTIGIFICIGMYVCTSTCSSFADLSSLLSKSFSHQNCSDLQNLSYFVSDPCFWSQLVSTELIFVPPLAVVPARVCFYSCPGTSLG